MKVKVWFLAMLLAAPLVFAQPVRALGADLQTAVWAASCMACHGPDGKAEGTGMTIGGRPSDELFGLMIAYKSGTRTGTIMHQHARGYSDEELKRIAQYFSQLK